jgi:hypothetical protein
MRPRETERKRGCDSTTRTKDWNIAQPKSFNHNLLCPRKIPNTSYRGNQKYTNGSKNYVILWPKVATMAPENPAMYSIDEDGRISVPKGMLPSWLTQPTEGGEIYFVPIAWKRRVTLTTGHELEAWYLWGSGRQDAGWVINPSEIAGSDSDQGKSNFHLRSLIYPARYDSKSRLCCVSLLNAIAGIASRSVWIAPEPGGVSIWTNFAFQTWYGRLGLS